MGYYKYVEEIYRGIREKIKDPENSDLRNLIVERKKEWRKSKPIERIEYPTRIDKARRYGYKAKQGFVVARVRVRRGGMRKSRPVAGRRPKRMGVTKITPAKSIQRIAEERSQKKFPNLEVLGSYWLWEDGQYKWYEVILVDPNHPVIQSDGDINWICEKQHTKRVFRGLTPAGKRGRGLRKKGKGAEKVRPSIRAKGRKAK
ncbi:MAG TPA: 50S ribosomal protein L15e [Candidatus Altiarchaeales archaeon]|nr:50S ribosomal protein L15e [Candidatus Altiarchaeales archaeon]